MRSDLINNLLDAMEIMARAEDEKNSTNPTVLATVIEQDQTNKIKYRVRVGDNERIATAINGVYKKGDQVYVSYPEDAETGIIIGLKYREGMNAISHITESNYEKLTPNVVSENNGTYTFNEEVLKGALAPPPDDTETVRTTTLLATFNLNVNTEVDENSFYKVVFKINFTEETKAREFAFTIDDVHGNPYFQINTAQFFEIEIPAELTYSNIESVSISTQDMSSDEISISNLCLYAAKKLDSNSAPSARLYAPNGTVFGGNWNVPFDGVITLKAEMRDEGLIQVLPRESYYWFKEDPLITSTSPSGYHSLGGPGWRLLDIAIDENDQQETDNPNELKIKSTELFRTVTKYKCEIEYNNLHYHAGPIEIKNNSWALPQLFFSYEESGIGNFLKAQAANIPTGAEAYFKVTAKDAFGKEIENFSRIESDNTWGPINRTIINGFNTYTCDLILDFESRYDEYIEQKSIEVKQLLKDFGRVVINGKKVYLYNEVGELEESVQPLSVKVYTDNTQTEELPHTNEDGTTNYSIKWILPDPDSSMIYSHNISSEGTELTPVIRNLYEYQYSTSNSIGVEIIYLDENGGSETTSIEMLFSQQGQAGTNGTQYICKIGIEEKGQGGNIKIFYPNALASETEDKTLPNLKVKLIRATDGQLIDVEDENIKKITLRVNEQGKTIEEENWPLDFPWKTAYILKANVTYNDLVYTAYLPVAYGNLDVNTGFYSVLYNSAGKNPKYKRSLFKDIDGKEININIVNPNGFFLYDDDSIYTIPFENIEMDKERVVVLSERNNNNYNDIIFSIPILFYFNRYENAAINGWDGDTVKINNDENYILAAQGGFGSKKDGMFTGVVLGTRQVDNKVENGIFGYKNGLETFLLNAETGDAKFKGEIKATSGWIGTDAKAWEINKDYINSGDLYLISAENQSARERSPIGQMLGHVNGTEGKPAVTDVCIRAKTAEYATFALTRSGQIYATEGCIAGWHLKAEEKANGDLDFTKSYLASSNGNLKLSPTEIKLDNVFSMGYNSKGEPIGNISGWSFTESGLFYSPSSSSEGIGLWPTKTRKFGTDDYIAIHAGANNLNIGGAPFRVTHKGALYSTSGEIGGWKINGDSLSSDNFTLYANKNGTDPWCFLYSDGNENFTSFTDLEFSVHIEKNSLFYRYTAENGAQLLFKDPLKATATEMIIDSILDSEITKIKYQVYSNTEGITTIDPIKEGSLLNPEKSSELNLEGQLCFTNTGAYPINVSNDADSYLVKFIVSGALKVPKFCILRKNGNVQSQNIKQLTLTTKELEKTKIIDFAKNFAIYQQGITYNTGGYYSGISAIGNPMFYAGATGDPDYSPFQVAHDGYTTIAKGQLGGTGLHFTISGNQIYSFTKSAPDEKGNIHKWLHGMSADHTGPVFWAGAYAVNEPGQYPNDPDWNDANFYVKADGTLILGNAGIPLGYESADLYAQKAYFWNLYASNTEFSNLNNLSAANTNSDIRLKNSITALSSNYETLFDNLESVSYKYNNGTSNRTHIGFIAQPTLEAVINAGFTQDEFAPLCLVDKGEENEHWAIRYEEFIALNTDQIQKAKKRINTLEIENQELKDRLKVLELKIKTLIQ